MRETLPRGSGSVNGAVGLIGFSIACAFCAAAAPRVTLETWMDTPFASSLVAAPSGNSIAWLVNEKGMRNIYVAQAPEWKTHAITAFDKDDGQEIAGLAWSPDGNTLYFARGGDFENGGENPNPDIDLSKPDQSIWSVSLNSGQPRKLTQGRDPAVAPDGTTVAFLRTGQVFSMNAQGENAKAAFTTKGSVEDLRWSPDGRHLAFTNVRGDHSFVGIYTPSEHAVSFPDASAGRDSNVAWSSDGKQLAYVHRPAEPRSFGPRRSGVPWSIRVLDVQSGRARECFLAQPGPGSVFHPTAADDQLFWNGDHVIFPWEHTGWLHLYSVDLSGGMPRELTPGTGEVEHISISRDRKWLYFSGNLADPKSEDADRRHIWKLNLTDASKAVAVTSGDGSEWGPAPLADSSAVAFLASSYTQKSHAAILSGTGAVRSLSAPTSREAAQLSVKPHQVLITAADGLVLHGQLFLPANTKSSERYPALIFVHGGSRRQMLLGYHYMYYYSNAYSLNQYLANRGYIVLSINYRSGIGYGLDFREALNYGPSGASEFQDVIGAGLYLKSRPDVDPKRIGIWGGSYGGYLTAMALARSSALFAAGVDFHGVHDWSTERNFEIHGGDPGLQEQAKEAARIAFESSPMASVDTWRSPVLLIHGDDDRNVNFNQTVTLAAALRERNVEFQELIFPNEIHDFLLHRHWMEAYRATVAFFDKHFGSGAAGTTPSSPSAF